jgi:putative glutamine amidotransferase
MTQPIYLFVYGTLRPGHAPASVSPLVDRCSVVGAGETRGRIYDLGHYPGCVIDPACDTVVHGCVLQVPDQQTLEKLDHYEGYNPSDVAGSLFLRTRCDVALDDGRTLRAEVYVYNRDVARSRLIPSGRYDPASAMRRPVIGITMDHKDDQSSYQLTFDYAKSIEAAGGLPFAIPYKVHPALIPQYVDLCDGILFTGGNDMDPSLYGEKWHPRAVPVDPARQDFELALLAEVERRRTPCLGVCFGSQIMNVHRGGSLMQFLPDREQPDALEHRKGDIPGGTRHAVKIEPGTILSKAIGKSEIIANSRHKQAVAQLGKGLRANAFSPDGVVEGIEDPSMPLFLAVQWHPENLSDAPEHLAPFRLLVERAAQVREEK